MAEFGTAAGGGCGIFGNAQCGKGTLLAAASSARPKVANYLFTTIVPNLGVCDLSRRRNEGNAADSRGGDGLVLCDIPGMIEGASSGVGLGYAHMGLVVGRIDQVSLSHGGGLFKNW